MPTRRPVRARLVRAAQMPWGTRRTAAGEGIGGQGLQARAAAQAGNRGGRGWLARVAESLPAVVHCRQPAVSFAYL